MSNQEPLVLVLSHLYPSAVSPADGTFVHGHARGLLDKGIRLQVVSPVPWAGRLLWRNPKWKTYGKIRQSGGFGGIPVMRPAYPVAPRPFHVFEAAFMAIFLLPTLARLRKSFPFNIVHSHNLTPDGWAGYRVARHFRVRSVCTLRGSDVNHYPHTSHLMMRMSVQALRGNDANVAVSRALSEGAIQLAGNIERPTVIYNGVNEFLLTPTRERPSFRRELRIAGHAPVILFIGRCERDKGLMELLTAFRAVRLRGFPTHLLIVGDGSYRMDLAESISRTGLADFVHMAGAVPHEEIGNYLNASDFFVLPSHSEGMPNALLEAMAFGLPSVATRVGGVPEVIEHMKNGVIVEPKNAAELESALVRLLSDPNFALDLGRAAAAFIRSRLSWGRNAEEHFRLYSRLLKRDD